MIEVEICSIVELGNTNTAGIRDPVTTGGARNGIPLTAKRIRFVQPRTNLVCLYSNDIDHSVESLGIVSRRLFFVIAISTGN